MSTDTVPDIYEKPGVPYSTSADLYSTTQIGAALPTVEVDSVVNYPLGGGAPSSDPLNITFNAADPIIAVSVVEDTPITPINLATHWSGGPPPKVYSIHSGTLPPGLALNATTGVVSGTPTTPQAAANVVFKGTDNNGNSANSNGVPFTITAAGDPLYTSTVLLLTAQAGNVDSSPIAKTLTPFTGTPVINSSLPINGAPTYLNPASWYYAPDTAYLAAQLTNQEFCFEMWVWLTAYCTAGFPEMTSFGGFSVSITDTGGASMLSGTLGGSFYGVSGFTVPLGAWTHLMLQRDKTVGVTDVVRVAKNGVLQGSSGTFAPASTYTPGGLTRVLGYHAGGQSPKLACGGLRLTKNSRRYLSFPFTPDPGPFLGS